MIHYISPTPYSPPPNLRMKTIPETLTQVERSLGALLHVAKQIVSMAIPRQAIPLLFERIDINARKAEDAMRLMQATSLASHARAIELTQCLTVIVLVADMVVSGHLTPTSLGDEELFLRNIARAQHCLAELQDEYTPL